MIACIVVAGGKRRNLLNLTILPALVAEGFDDLLVVGEHRADDRWRYFHVPDLTKTTNDALVKRDIGTLATEADILVYLSDDHMVLPGFAEELRDMIARPIAEWDVLVPSRWSDHPQDGRIRIPNGEENKYCAGHGGVFRRRVVTRRPWTTYPHHRLWDLLISHQQLSDGVRYLCYPRLRILDCEPEAQPWN